MRSLIHLFIISLTATIPLINCSCGSNNGNSDPLLREHGQDLKTITLTVPKISCPPCKANIENALKKLDGIDSVTASVSDKSVKITYDASLIDVKKIKKTLEDMNYPATE